MEKSKTFRGLFLFVGLFSAIALTSPKAALAEGCVERCGHGDKKSLFCHVPQGNPDNVQEICIADSAVSHHLQEHVGDHCGACEIACEEITCCPAPTPEETAELLSQDGELLLEDSDGNIGELCCEPDTDGDGQCGDGDLCPDDPEKTDPGACGCGVSDVDANENGTPDCNDTPDGELQGLPDTPNTPPTEKPRGNSFGGGFCQLLKTDEVASSHLSLTWALLFGATTLLLWTLRQTPALRSRAK